MGKSFRSYLEACWSGDRALPAMLWDTEITARPDYHPNIGRDDRKSVDCFARARNDNARVRGPTDFAIRAKFFGSFFQKRTCFTSET
jgi:hypothetical protein